MTPSLKTPIKNLEPNWSDSITGTVKPLSADAWVAVLGGGQLGLMFADAARALGFRVAAYDPDPNAPVKPHADRVFTAPYDDEDQLKELTSLCEAATVEFENIPFPAMAFVAGRIPLRPPVDAVAVAQDRIEEKALFARNALPFVPYMIIQSETDIEHVNDAIFPGRLKTTRLGYDGKGQIVVEKTEDLLPAFRKLGGVPCVLEKQIKLQGEISVLVCRDVYGDVATWQPAENFHKNGILDVTVAPARIPQSLATEAADYAMTLARSLGFLGVLCVEFFIGEDSKLYLNEIAPRPHNSGHHTIESCTTSQFTQQARITAMMPLAETVQNKPAVMINLLGDLWLTQCGTPVEPDWNAVVGDNPGVTVHIYGKTEARNGRKMGHITIVAETQENAIAIANQIRDKLGMPPVGDAPKIVRPQTAPQQLWELSAATVGRKHA
jgi:5-(carboxyamino)imidazole ribonucleotide synthase